MAAVGRRFPASRTSCRCSTRSAYLESAVASILDQDYAGRVRDRARPRPVDRRHRRRSSTRLVAARPAHPRSSTTRAWTSRSGSTSRSRPAGTRSSSGSTPTPSSSPATRAAASRPSSAPAPRASAASWSRPASPGSRPPSRAPTTAGSASAAARYHGEQAHEGPAESRLHGHHARATVLAEVGGFDETLRRGEDWELNYRLRTAGHLVWLDPQLRVTYWPREHLGEAGPPVLRDRHLARRARASARRRATRCASSLRPLLVIAIALSLLLIPFLATGLLTGWPAWVARPRLPRPARLPGAAARRGRHVDAGRSPTARGFALVHRDDAPELGRRIPRSGVIRGARRRRRHARAPSA